MSFVVGLIFVLNDSAAGWIFFIIGIGYLGLLPQVASNPRVLQWALIGITLLFVLLLVVAGSIFLLK
jgi:hypothetical protein